MRSFGPACTCTSTSGRSKTAAPATSSTASSVAFPAATPDDAAFAYPAPSTYFVHNDATGGESIPEAACAVNDAAEVPSASFPRSPAPSAGSSSSSGARRTSMPTTDEPRFDPMRNGFFHYLLYSHARGSGEFAVPVSETTAETPPGSIRSTNLCSRISGETTRTSTCRTEPQASRTCPASTRWSRSACRRTSSAPSTFQASTTLHELGHTMELWHGGAPPAFARRRIAGHVNGERRAELQAELSEQHELSASALRPDRR